MGRWSSRRHTNRDRRAGGGFSLTELLVVLGLTALLAAAIGQLMGAGALVGDRGAAEARKATLYAETLMAIGDDLRAARGAAEWKSGGIELAFADRDVRYAGAMNGVYRAVRPSGGSWTVDPPEGLLDWEEGTLTFSVDGDGLVQVDLAGDGVSYRTAVFPRGVFAGVLGEGAEGGNGRGNDDEGQGNGRGNDDDDGDEGQGNGRGNDGNNGRGEGKGGGRGPK